MKRKPPVAPPEVKSAPTLLRDANQVRLGKVRDKLRKALDDPDMREQMVRVIRQFMAEEK